MTDKAKFSLNDRSEAPLTADEGGLRAPPELRGWRKFWWWFDFLILVKLARLRFIALLTVIGVVITQWDTLAAYYEKWTRAAGAAAAAEAGYEYFCPMHPAVVRDNPKEKCPICFMPLAKRKKGALDQQPLPAGIVSRVQLSPYRIALAGARTWKVDYVPLVKEISAIGYIEFDERGQRNVSARIKGRIDKLMANETGQIVAAGDPLASLYSPELNVTAENLLAAQRQGNDDLLASARNRLALLGISDDQIDEIARTGKVNTHLTIRSPISGHVIKKYVQEGQYVDEGSPLYDIADLSTVWIQAQVYEDDMAFLPLEQTHSEASPGHGVPMIATTRALPNELFHGTLAFIYPHVDQDTRTVMVRCELPNPGHKLRPGSTATVTLQLSPRDLPLFSTTESLDPIRQSMLEQGMVPAVPENAVIDTGRQKIVYREAAPGLFEGVDVQLGPRMSSPDDVQFFPVLGGLAAGDRIVTAGSFLIDAETRLNPAAGSIYIGGNSGSKPGGQSTTAVRPSTPEDDEAQVRSALAQLSAEDRAAVEAQRFCPVLDGNRLGSMGPPMKLVVGGEPVYVCCAGCKQKAQARPQETLAKVAGLKAEKNRRERP